MSQPGFSNEMTPLSAAMAADSGVISFENPGWDMLPDWLWPGLAMVFLLGALWSYGKHRQQR